MKKVVISTLFVGMSILLGACGNLKDSENISTTENIAGTDEVVSVTQEVKEQEKQEELSVSTETDSEAEKRYIEMLVNDGVYKIELYDTTAANALYEKLPLTLSFEDYNNIEKISYLPEKLPTDGEPDGCDPDVGDLCLYAPWGNLSVFYKDFRYSDSLIMLGYFENSIEAFESNQEDFEAILRIAE